MKAIYKLLSGKKGAAMAFTLVVYILVTSSIGAMMMLQKQNFNSAIVDQLNTKSLYITRQSCELALAALNSQKDVNSNSKIPLLKSITTAGVKPNTESVIVYSDGGENVGRTNIFYKTQMITNNGKDELWFYIYLTTMVYDYIVVNSNIVEGNNHQINNNEYLTYYVLKVLASDPTIQELDIIALEDYKEAWGESS